MKTFYSKYRFRAVAVLLCSLAALASCSSDSEPAPVVVPTPDPSEGMATISLSFAAPSIQSRADEPNNPFARDAQEEESEGYDPVDTDAHETNIDDIWVYFLSVKNGSSSLWKAFNITDDSSSSDYTSMSKPESIKTIDQIVISGLNIPQGDYKVYVVANVAGYVGSDASINPSNANSLSAENKAKFEETLLNYTFNTVNSDHDYENDNEGIICGNLPMGAHFTDVALSNVSGTLSQGSDKIIHIEKGTGTISAALTYLCSKVRYTFFFDNTVTTDSNGNTTSLGFSYPIQKFEYEVMGVHNSMKDAALFPNYIAANKLSTDLTEKDIIDDPSDQTKGCVASQYPSDGDLAKWLNSTTNTSAMSLSPLGNGAAKPTTGKIAYQGLIYLPENKGTTATEKNADGTVSKGNKTYLHLKVYLDGELKDYIINLPDKSSTAYLTHGYFYDIVGRITSGGAEFNVRVKKWVKSNNGTSHGI